MYKIGIDEVGRGPWFGPVVACAFCFNYKNMPSGDFVSELNDSKKLTEKKRELIYKNLINMSLGNNPKIFFGVGVVDNYLIDEINIREANKEAMRRAMLELFRKIESQNIGLSQKDYVKGVFIDGNDNYRFIELDKDPIFIIGGDAKVLEISAASIIAKVFRDKIVKTYAELYPDLGLENHKGYGTKKHIDYLKDKSKISSFHRLSYKPVKKVLESKPKLLLHVCCGPDAAIPILDLKDIYDIVCFWYDPNIQPKKEYDKRLKHFKKICQIEKIDYIEGVYDVENFFHNIKGLENTPEKGEKCSICYDMRLKKTALLATKLGIKYWTTTLNMSPHKDLERLFIIGDKYSLKNNLEFLKIAFRKDRGFERSVEYTTKYGIYRQNYCGCIYSDTFKIKK